MEWYLGNGVLLLDHLLLLGFYLRGLIIYWPVGGIGLASTHHIFGIWYQIVRCGLFGGSKIIVFLKIWCFLETSS